MANFLDNIDPFLSGYMPSHNRIDSWPTPTPPGPGCGTDPTPYLQSWTTRDTYSVSAAIRTAITHQINLEQAVAKVEQLVNTTPTHSDPHRSTDDILTSLKSSSEGLRNFISALADPKFFKERTSGTDGQSRAQDVFEIPELLGLVLSFAGMKEILEMMQVSKSTMATIRSSAKLQRQLHLRPKSSSYFEIPSLFKLHRTLAVCAKATGSTRQHWWPSIPFNFPAPKYDSAQLTADFMTSIPGRLPRIGSTCKAMFVCQPPITEMTYTLTCCSASAPTVPTVNKITVSEGITVGHLYRKAKELTETHKLCPSAPAYMLNEKGYVVTHVHFHGKVKLLPDDPYIAPYPQPVDSFEMADWDQIGMTGASDRMETYTATKKAAHGIGLPIPTLDEFEAAGGTADAWMDKCMGIVPGAY